MMHRRTRDYEVSLWTLQDSPIAILKPYGLEFKGQIQDGKLQDKDDGTQTFTFSIPMYLIRNGQKIENPCWYNVQQGHLLANLRKIKVIFNKNYEDGEDRKIYEFLIVKATENHEEQGQLFCDVECEGLAFHELGKLGYKISLTAEDFYNDDYDWSTDGKWITGKGKQETQQPLASLNYWNDKVFGTTDNWDYEIQMDWSAYSLWEYTVSGNLTDTTAANDLRAVTTIRLSNKVYEDDFVDSWELDKQTEQIIPKHITGSREKARVSLDIHDSNIYNITQTLAQTFGVFCKYVYQHDENLRITKRKVVYYNNFLKENEGIMDIAYPYQISSVKREIDSSDIVTKLFVKQVQDDSNSNGMLNILDVGANKSKEDYILNFDYLYQSGGITKEQYEAVDTYITNIREINEQIAPYSAKVISLESQLVKLQAELTTRTNAIAKDTEELAMGQELVNAITNGDEVLQVTEKNPQNVVLMKDSSKKNNSYYIKLTQKGIYAETIRIYKRYSYTNAKLDPETEITTGKVQFDQFGNVNKISNIYCTDDDPKTVYVTYSYRPKLYYESIVEMWSARLAQDTARKAELDIQIAKINYNLYGRNSKYSMQGINLANITDINLKGKFKNLIQNKNNLIKEFNALMGPALREGYWQPENYTDYGDQYNDSFNLSMNESEKIQGTTGNSYFLWDDKLFDNQQRLYYEYTAAQQKIPYPCIDLTTTHGRQILQLIANNDIEPISFVFKPVTAEADNPYPTTAPEINYSLQNNKIYVVPGLYQWDNEVPTQIKFSTSFQQKINNELVPLYYYRSGLNDRYLYNGLINASISAGYKQGYTNFYWQYSTPDNENKWTTITSFGGESPNITMKNSSPLLSYARLTHLMIDNVNYNEDRPYLQLLSTPNKSLENYRFRLIAGNNRGSNLKTDANGQVIQASVVPVIVELLVQNSVIVPDGYQLIQHAKYTESNSNFNLCYKVHNDTDKTHNHYQWIMTKNNNGTPIILAEYFGTQMFQEDGIIFDNDYKEYLSINITIDDETHDQIHNLIIQNGIYNGSKLFQQELGDSNQWTIKLIVRNIADYLNNTQPENVSQYKCAGASALPWIDITRMNQENEQSIEFTQTHSFTMNVHIKMASSDDNNNLASQWTIGEGNDLSQFQSLSDWVTQHSTVFDSFNVTSINTTSNTTAKATGVLTIKQGKADEAINDLANKIIYVRMKNNSGWCISGWKFTNFTITNPITASQSWDNNTSNIILATTEHNVVFELSAENATKYNWEIILPNNNKIDIPELNSTNLSQTSQGRYVAEYLPTGSRLTITIPAMNTSNQFQDKGTKIRCKCNNGSNNPVYVPSANEYTILDVNYPVQIINDNYETDWWPFADKISTLTELEFKIPIAIADRNTSNKVDTSSTITHFTVQGSINSLEQINSNNNETTLTSTFIFINSNSIKYIKTENDEVFFKYAPQFKCINTDQLVINEQSIIDTSSTVNDNKYQLKGTFTLTYNYNNNNIITSKPIILKVRQCAPQLNEANTNIQCTKFYHNNIDEGPGTSQTFTYRYNPNFVPRNPLIIMYNDQQLFSVNQNSFYMDELNSCINWKCGHYTVNELSNVSYTYVLFDPIQGDRITILYLKRSESSIGINSYQTGGGMYSLIQYAGCNKNLYLEISNPWGKIITKRFEFIANN